MRQALRFSWNLLIFQLCALLLFPPQLLFAADLTAAGTTNTQVTTAKNGVPVVNIAAPSASGLSHNQFTNYNVGSQGLVLNNGDQSQQYWSSQLAGQVAANPNLSSGVQASVILNEVTSTSRSVLAGFTEVTGGKADVIVANPNGITTNGGGFLNTNRVSLVTGTPNVSGGALQSFTVNGGDILVTGTGLNASAQQILDLVSRKISVDGQINANTLNLVAGRNTWSPSGGGLSNLGAAGSPPTYGIDASALGAMYAGRIVLQSTEAGVGVRMQNQAASTADDFSISSAGKIVITGNLSAARDLSLTSSGSGVDAISETDASLSATRNLSITGSGGSAGITLTGGSLYAGGDMNLSAATLTDAASSTAGVTDANKRYGGTGVSLTSAGAAGLNGVAYSSGGDLTLTAGSVAVGNTAQASLTATGAMNVTTSGGTLNFANALLQAAGDMTFAPTVDLLFGASTQVKDTGGAIYLGPNTAATSTANITNAGQISADVGSIHLNNSGLLTVSGTMYAADRITGNPVGGLTVSGQMLGGMINLQGINGDVNVTGTMQSQSNFILYTVGSHSINVGSTGRIIVAASGTGQGDIEASGNINNSGVIFSADNTSYNLFQLMAGQDLTNGATGGISALNALSMTASTGTVDNYGALYSGVAVQVVGGKYIYNEETGTIDGYDVILAPAQHRANIINYGAITADNNVTVSGNFVSGLRNVSSHVYPVIIAGHDFIFTPYIVGGQMDSYFDNSYYALISAGHDINITGISSSYTAGYGSGYTCDYNMTSCAANEFGNGGTLRAGNAITVTKFTSADSYGNAGSPLAATITALSATSVTYPGLTLTLPTNPNGRFITTSSSNSQYLVESNPLYTNLENYLGSDYLATKYNFSSDTVTKRLGDAAYETQLVQTQLVAQTGTSLLTGYTSAKVQMQALMDSAGTQAASLGLTYGTALTAAQQANLTSDMIWMVTVTVNGQQVLAPVVYLAASTKKLFENESGGGGMAAKTVTLEASSITNSGSIKGGTVNLAATNNITNDGGTIAGSDSVRVVSTMGSVINKTETVSDGKGGTTLGSTGSISSGGKLVVAAGRSIINEGANMSASGGAVLVAREDIYFDTVATGSSSSSKSGNTSSSSSTVKNNKSSLSSGSNITMVSGRDTTLAGTDVSAKGDVNVYASGNVNVVDREDSTTKHSSTSTEGFGVGGGLYGWQTTTTDEQHIRSVGSSLSGNNVNIYGTNVDLKGAALKAVNDIDIAADTVTSEEGRNIDSKTTTTTTTSIFSVTAPGKTSFSADADAKADAEAKAQQNGKAAYDAKSSAEAEAQASTIGDTAGTSKSSASANKSAATGTSASVSASADASTKANATADAGGIDVLKENITTTSSYDSTAVKTTLSSGGNTKISARKSISLQGTDLAAKGDIDLDAQDVSITAAKDVHTTTTSTQENKTGLYLSTTNNANTDVNLAGSASVGTTASSGSVSVGASGSADSSNNIDTGRFSQTTTTTTDTKNVASTVSAGGNLRINSGNKLTVQGSDLSGEKSATVTAKDMEFLAGQDTHTTTTTTSNTAAGTYMDFGGKASASFSSSGAVGGGATGAASADASASANYGVGAQARNVTSTSTDASTTARVSTIKSGSGSVTRAASNSITDVGTSIDAAQDFNQSAKTWTSKAAENTTTSTSSTMSNSAKAGIYLTAGASAGASAEGGVGAGLNGDADAKAKAYAGIGGSAAYTGSLDQSQTTTSNAVVSTIHAGRSLSSTTTDATKLEGTSLSGDTAVNLSAGSLDYSAAKNTTSTTTLSGTVGVAGQLAVTVEATHAVGAEGQLTGTVTGTGTTSDSSTAVVGGVISKNGNINISTTGDTRLEGVTLNSKGDTNVAAGGDLKYEAAKDTTSGSTTTFSANGSVSTNGGAKSVGITASADGSYHQETSATSTAEVGDVKAGGSVRLTSGKTATLEGTTVDAKGDITVSGDKGVVLSAAKNTSSSETIDASASGKVGVKAKTSTDEKDSSKTTDTGTGSIETSASGSYSKETSTDATGGSLTAGRNLVIKSGGGDVNMEGTTLEAGNKASVAAGGSVNFKAAESSSESISAGGSVSASNETEVSKTSKTGSSDTSKETTTKNAASLSLNGSDEKKTSQTGGSIKAGDGGIEITAQGGDVNLVGTAIETSGGGSIEAKRNVTFTAAKSTDTAVGGSVNLNLKLNTKTESGSDSSDKSSTDKSSTNKSSTDSSSNSSKKNTGTGGTQGSDGSTKGDKDLSTWQDKQSSVINELKSKQSGSSDSGSSSGSGSSGSSSTSGSPKADSTKSGSSTKSSDKKDDGSILDNMGNMTGTAQGGTGSVTTEDKGSVKAGGVFTIKAGGTIDKSGTTFK
jgi:filamentous haemagglutinin family N-terminal domain